MPDMGDMKMIREADRALSDGTGAIARGTSLTCMTHLEGAFAREAPRFVHQGRPVDGCDCCWRARCMVSLPLSISLARCPVFRALFRRPLCLGSLALLLSRSPARPVL
eukprot:1294377-Rhodomonas_salina.1